MKGVTTDGITIYSYVPEVNRAQELLAWEGVLQANKIDSFRKRKRNRDEGLMVSPNNIIKLIQDNPELDREEEVEEVTFRDNMGKPMTEAEYNKRYKQCVACDDVLQFMDTDDQYKISSNEAYCPDCVHQIFGDNVKWLH